MSGTEVTRRGFLGGAGLLMSDAAAQPGSRPVQDQRHRTQFDAQLLEASSEGLVLANHGRQVTVTAEGEIRTALAWGGDRPRVRVYRGRAVEAEYKLDGQPSAPVFAGDSLWFSAGTQVYRDGRPVGVRGTLLDGAAGPDGAVVLAVAANGSLALIFFDTALPRIVAVDEGSGRASLDFGSDGKLHVCYEKRQGIEYREFRGGVIQHSERAAEAFGFHPVLLAQDDRVVLAYLGESCRIQTAKSGGEAWERLGRGGYVAALVRYEGKWRRHRLADSRAISKALYPIGGPSSPPAEARLIGSYNEGEDRRLISRMEEFSPPALCAGADGSFQVLWCDRVRQWIYGARFGGDEFMPLNEIRGPLEALTGPCLVPKRCGRATENLPIAMVTSRRVYADSVATPPRRVVNGRQIDFITPDEIAWSTGCEAVVNMMQRRPENPVIPIDPPGGPYAYGLVHRIFHDENGWRADLHRWVPVVQAGRVVDYIAGTSGSAVSRDGIHWTKVAPDAPGAAHSRGVHFMKDPAEPNPAHRYKGLLRSREHNPWGWAPVTSPDGSTWEPVPNPRTIVRTDDDLHIWMDPYDVPARRYKINAIGRSFCGRIAVQYTSPNGMDWYDERDTLDFSNPYGASPDVYPTGRILLDSWSGPDEESEIHGGFVFRDGDRWLLHYMKWTPDGHIYCALAASRDGLNFSRVGGGAVTLPLGEAGTWDAGRVALREAPFRAGDVWRQYYTGSGWKHGLSGTGARTSHVGTNAPNQTGVAEIRAGRWVHLQTTRQVYTGEVATAPLDLVRPHTLAIDCDDTVAAAVFDPSTGNAVGGFGFADFAAVQGGAATWRGKGLESLGARSIQLRARLSGPHVKLYSLRLVPHG